jgi:capsule polysaccharide export protein KpsE/RkpR
LAAVAPVTDLRTPDVDDKSTWQIVYSQQPTQAQRDAAQAILAAYDLAAEVATLTQQDEAARARLATFTSDPGVVDLLNRAKTASIAEIDNWLANNMTTLAQARAITAAEIKLLVIIAARLGLI